MQASNLSWLEVEARYRIAERTAPTRSRRRPAVSFPSAFTPRRMIGQRLIVLGTWLVEPRPVDQRSAA